jgi:dTDP-4-amino-4,6-dideoxygalactose transaminase
MVGSGFQADESFPGATRFAEGMLGIPISPELTDENLERMASEMNTFCAGNHQHE